MADSSCAFPQKDAAVFDTVVICVDQLRALAALLSVEEVAERFSDLSTGAQVSIFGLFEDVLADIRSELTSNGTLPID